MSSVNETSSTLIQQRFTTAVSRALLDTDPERRNSSLFLRKNLPPDDTLWASLLLAGKNSSGMNLDIANNGNRINVSFSNDSNLTMTTSISSNSTSSLKSSESVNDYLDCLVGMAEERIQLKKYNEALSCYEEILRIQKFILQPSLVDESTNVELDLASTLSSSAYVHIMMKNVAKANECLNEAIPIYINAMKRMKETKTIEVKLENEYLNGLAFAFKMVASVFIQKGEFKKAKSACMEALRMYRVQLSNVRQQQGKKGQTLVTKEDISMLYIDIGDIQCFEGKFNEAKGSFLTALNGLRHRKSILANIANKLSTVGEKLLKRGALDEALEAFSEVLNVRRIILDKFDIDIASSLVRIGDTLERKGLLELSLNSYMQSLEIASKHLGSNDESVREIVKKIGMIRSYVPGVIQH